MNRNIFTKSRLAASISLCLATTLMPAMAQETTAKAKADSEIEVIQIKGIRGSLIRSMDVKREANGVVDSISAEDMGKFPDTNLAESLQRITGVSVSRSNGEGSQITVRGFGPDFNLVTLNGRQMPGTGNSRSYNLENLSSEGVSALEVQKTARAENPSGGLGATVNIITAKPLTRPGEHYSLSGKAMYDSSNEMGDDVTPELAAIYSNTFADDKVGFAISLSHQERDFQKQSANIQGWHANPTLPTLTADKVVDRRATDASGKKVGNYFLPKDMNYSIEDVQRERSNGQITFQYEPMDGLVGTIDYTASKALTGSNSIGWGIWNDFGANINAYELDERGTAVFMDVSGNDGSFTASKGTTEVLARSLGLNLAWEMNDDWSFGLDYHDSDNKTDNGADKGSRNSGQVILGSDQLVSKMYDYRTGEIPQAMVFWRNGTNELSPAEIDSNFSQFFHSPGKSEIQQLQFDGTWNNNQFKIPLVNVKFGAAYTDQTMGGYNAWSGLRGGPGFTLKYPQIFPDNMFVRHNTANFLNKFAGGGSALQPNYYYTFDYDEAVARQTAYLNEALLGADAYVPDPYFDGIDSQGSVQEQTQSVYVQSQWEFEAMAFPVQLNAGVRYEQTDVTSVVKQKVEKQVNWDSASEWIMYYQSASDDDFLSLEGDHDVLLPMLDLKVDLTDEVVARFSWGKTIARAPLGNLAGGRSLSGSPKPGARIGSQGNPDLLPFTSTNLDLSLEYYYAEGSYAAIGYFQKDVDNFIKTASSKITIPGLHDILDGPRYRQAVSNIVGRGEVANQDRIYAEMLALGYGNAAGKIEPTSADPLIVWDISQPANSSSKSVEGVEFAVQHLIGETGFGVGVNGTWVDGDIKFDTESLEQQDPLPGLSNSANFQVFYEYDGWSAKVTYAWRDSYLIGVGQSQATSDNPPQFAKTYGQWDMNLSYAWNENLSVFLEGVNINNETEQGYGRYEEQFLFARQYGPRYSLGARYNF
jgi:TonB-dependent receptor